MAEELFRIGDVITIKGVATDGTLDDHKPRKQWRVKAPRLRDVVLQPLHDNGTVDTFNDACGEFVIQGGTE